MVRNMSDEAILELVRNKLGVAGEGAAAKPAPVVKVKRRRGPAAREALLAQVESAVKSSPGLSAGEIARETKLSQSRVQSALRELKKAGRIHQGGDKRWARYAVDKETALQASEHARNK